MMTQTNLQLNSAAFSSKRLNGKSLPNEGSYVELKDLGFFAVADEVGGARSEELASQIIMEILNEAFVNLQEEDAEERMETAIKKANDAIFQMSKDIPRLSAMAATFVGLYINGNIATIAHVGGSRLYRVDADGNFYRETQNNSVHLITEDKNNEGTLQRRSTISCALGLENKVVVNRKILAFEAGTTFLLCSEVVVRYIGENELREILHVEDDASAICQNIVNICDERGVENKLTVIVVKSTEKKASLTADDLEEETVAAAETPLTKRGALVNVNSQDVKLTSKASAKEFSGPKFKLKKPSSTADRAPAKESVKNYPVAHSSSVSKGNSKVGTKLESKGQTKFGTSFELKGWVDQIKDIKFFRSAPDFLHVVFSFLPWALLGITLLILISLIWVNRSGEDLPKTAENLRSQSQNAVLISFEQKRRNVDNDPAKYIDENITPKSAIDTYLLGRAHFLQKNYSLAKIYLEQAKRDLLNENFSMTNRKALQNEILMMMTIIDTPEARETFERSY